MRKRDLESLVSKMGHVARYQQKTIDELRAKLCRDGHDWVLADTSERFDSVGGLMFFHTYVCARCGMRKVEQR